VERNADLHYEEDKSMSFDPEVVNQFLTMLPDFAILYIFNAINPLPPSDSETEKIILEDLISSVLSQFEKYHPSGNLKFNYLGIFPKLKIAYFNGKILPISLKLNSTRNTLSCYGLSLEPVEMTNQGYNRSRAEQSRNGIELMAIFTDRKINRV